MSNSISLVEFSALAEFRYLIRVFLNRGELAARAAGLEPQQYLLMLMLRGLQAGGASTIGDLAERMQLRHNSVVELVDRLERRQLLRRERSRIDRRRGGLALDAARRQVPVAAGATAHCGASHSGAGLGPRAGRCDSFHARKCVAPRRIPGHKEPTE